jgi:broad specificity phosphatase PhoE
MASHLFRSGRELALLTAAPPQASAAAAPETGVDKYKRVLSVNARDNIINYQSVRLQLWDYIYECNTNVVTQVAVELKKKLDLSLTCVEFSDTGTASPTDWLSTFSLAPISSEKITVNDAAPGIKYNILVLSNYNADIFTNPGTTGFDRMPHLVEYIDFKSDKWIIKIGKHRTDWMVAASLGKLVTSAGHVYEEIEDDQIGHLLCSPLLKNSARARFSLAVQELSADRSLVKLDVRPPLNLWSSDADRLLFEDSLVQIRLEDMIVGIGNNPLSQDLLSATFEHKRSYLKRLVQSYDVIDRTPLTSQIRGIVPAVAGPNYYQIYGGMYAAHFARVILMRHSLRLDTELSEEKVIRETKQDGKYFSILPDERDYVRSRWVDIEARPYDTPLSFRGVTSARLSVEKLKREVPIDMIVSSPFRRCVHTAAIAAGVLNIGTITIDNRLGELHERLKSYLTCIGKSAPEYMSPDEQIKITGNIVVNWDRGRLASNAYAQAMADYAIKDENVLIITHGDVINTVMPFGEGLDFSAIETDEAGWVLIDSAKWQNNKFRAAKNQILRTYLVRSLV